MVNPFTALPSYIRESPKFSKFLELVNAYLISGAIEVSLYKNGFITDTKLNWVIATLARQVGVTIEIPFNSNGNPDWATYYQSLYLAYLARVFNLSFKGTMDDFIERDPTGGTGTVSVIDFSVAKGWNQPGQGGEMAVVYSVLSMSPYLTADIVRNILVPHITGVNGSTYYLQFGQFVFGYDVDVCARIINGHAQMDGDKVINYHTVYVRESDGIKVVDEELIQNFTVVSAFIENVGSGYVVGDVVTVDVMDGSSVVGTVQLEVLDLREGAALSVVNATAIYPKDPGTPQGSSVAVSGGSGTGMTVAISSSTLAGYSIRGFDTGLFLSLSRRQ